MNNMDFTARISATISQELLSFLDQYQQEHALASRSAALVEAIQALKEREHVLGYQALGQAQQNATERYPQDPTDGLDDTDPWR